MLTYKTGGKGKTVPVPNVVNPEFKEGNIHTTVM